MKSIKSLEYENLCLLKRGDSRALTFFYNKYAKKVFSLAFFVLKDRFVAEDVLQEVFVHFWNQRESFEEEKDIWLVLYVMCKQKSLNKLRSIIRYEKCKEHHVISFSSNYDEIQYGVNDIKKILELALEKMTPTQQKVFHMSRNEGLTHSEIAQMLSVSPNTVKNHMVAALVILKRYFKGYEFISLFFLFFIVLY